MRRLLGYLVLLILFSPLALAKTCELLHEAPAGDIPYYAIQTCVGECQNGECSRRLDGPVFPKLFITRERCECHLIVDVKQTWAWQCQEQEPPRPWSRAVTVTTKGNRAVVEFRYGPSLRWIRAKRVQPQDMVALYAGNGVDLNRRYGRNYGAVFRQKESAENIGRFMKVKLGATALIPVSFIPDAQVTISYVFVNVAEGSTLAVKKERFLASRAGTRHDHELEQFTDDVPLTITNVDVYQHRCTYFIEGTAVEGVILCKHLSNEIATTTTRGGVFVLDIVEGVHGARLRMTWDPDFVKDVGQHMENDLAPLPTVLVVHLLKGGKLWIQAAGACKWDGVAHLVPAPGLSLKWRCQQVIYERYVGEFRVSIAIHLGEVKAAS